MAKQTDENGKPLTYWCGLEKSKQELHTCKYCKVETTQPDDECYARPKQESYICPHTNVQCDDECCVSAENCNIDNDELEYPISEDCEAVKNWDSFVEQKNNQLEVEKLAEEVYGKGVNYDYEEGYVDGYNKAKETLYSEIEVLQVLLRLQQTESYDNLYEWFEQFKKKNNYDTKSMDSKNCCRFKKNG